MKHCSVQSVLARMAQKAWQGQERGSTLPTFSPEQSRLDRMKEYSAILTARNSQKKIQQSLVCVKESTSPRSVTSVVPPLRPQPRKAAVKSMTTEIYCNPCTRDNLQREAAGYCIECSEYFCETCIKHHRNLKITKNHTTQDRQQMPKGNSHIPDEETIEICSLHREELVRYFCKDHDEPICTVCATLKHRACSDVAYIPELQSTETNKRCIDAIKYMKTLAAQFEKVQSNTEQNIQELDKMQSDFKQNIVNVRQDISDLLKQLEQEAILSMESLHQTEQCYLNDRVQTCKEAVKEVQLASQQLESAKKNGIDSKVFLYMRKINKHVSHYEELLADIQSKNRNSLKFKFKRADKIKDFLHTANCLGHTDIVQQPVRTIKLLTQFKVDSRMDQDKPCITGSCVLDDGRIVLADSDNQSVKIASHNQLITQSKLSSEPWDVCAVSKDQVIVSLPYEQKLQFLTIGSTVHPLRKIGKVESLKSSQYYGVAHTSGKLFVTCPKDDPPNVKILDMQGSLLQQIPAVTDTSSVFSNPLYITTSRDGNRIYVSDCGNNSVIVVDVGQQDNEDKVIEMPDNNPVGGLCLTAEGDIYMCGYQTHSVHQLSPDQGIPTMDVIGSEGGLLHPQSICYNAQGRQLLVTMEKSNLVKIFQLF